jgi:hypothetical protein
MMQLPHHARRNSRRPSRALTALCTLVLVAGNALAAMGLCVAKTPSVPTAPAALAASQAPCPQHFASDRDAAASPDRAAPTHCPQDDPSAKVRSGDAPVAGFALVSALPRPLVACETGAGSADGDSNNSPPTPLYTRLSRLLL